MTAAFLYPADPGGPGDDVNTAAAIGTLGHSYGADGAGSTSYLWKAMTDAKPGDNCPTCGRPTETITEAIQRAQRRYGLNPTGLLDAATPSDEVVQFLQDGQDGFTGSIGVFTGKVDVSGLAWFNDPVELAAKADADVIVELIGGADGPARAAVEAAIARKKHVVTANKALLAYHGFALAKSAEAAAKTTIRARKARITDRKSVV